MKIGLLIGQVHVANLLELETPRLANPKLVGLLTLGNLAWQFGYLMVWTPIVVHPIELFGPGLVLEFAAYFSRSFQLAAAPGCLSRAWSGLLPPNSNAFGRLGLEWMRWRLGTQAAWRVLLT